MQHNVPHSHSTTNDAANLGSEKSRSSESYSHCCIKSHCQSLLLWGMAPRSIFSGSPVVYQEAPLQIFPLQIHQKTSEEKWFEIQTPQIHNKNEKQKVRPCLCHCGRPQHARFTKLCDGFVVKYTLIWQFFSFPFHHGIMSFSIKQAQLNPSTEKMRPLQKVGRANQSSNLASPVTCKCINNDFSGPIKAQEWGFWLVVPPSHMANCDPM